MSECVSLFNLRLSFVQPSHVAGTEQRHRKEFRTISSELTVGNCERGEGWREGGVGLGGGGEVVTQASIK